MVDFFKVSYRSVKKDIVEIYPRFIINNASKDLMIRGGDFYAIWLEDEGRWSTEEQDVVRLVDRELDIYAEQHRDKFDGDVRILHMWDAASGMIDIWHKYCQKQLRDNFHMLDERLIFSDTDVKKEDYASKRLPYPLKHGSTEAWERLTSVLYSEEERLKIEWAIGAVVSGDSKTIQKFLVLYGAAGTGKSTILNIIQQLFEGYYSVFDARSLGSANNAFALEAFKSNPLVAIQHDGDLSHIEDNTRLNSLVSHELMTVNEKFRSAYANRFKCFLFMGTNKPVRITDAKSGLIRRLIDVSPTGNKVSGAEYKRLMKQITFELGAIASRCLDIYRENPDRYDDYVSVNMLGASNDFYNYILDSFGVFSDADQTTLKAAWKLYNAYCEDAKVAYPFSQRIFKEELRNYFADFKERATLEDGTRVRNLYSGFLTDKFQTAPEEQVKETPAQNWIEFKEQPSILDDILCDCPAQYANDIGTPFRKWANVKTKLSDISTDKLHYVKVPEHHIVIDFDIPDESGNKSLERNLAEAEKWPKTYAELSKSGCGIHLHYIYDGDPSTLSRIFAENVEIKVFTGDSSLRRKLSKCNDIPIATLTSGLPLKGGKMVNFEGVKNESMIRRLIKKNLAKKIHPATKPSIDFIYDILEKAYQNKDLVYDVSDMQTAVIDFASNSTHQAEYCLKLVQKMHFASDKEMEPGEDQGGPLIFFDIEVAPNLTLVCWKKKGGPCVRIFNPSPSEILKLLDMRLVGYNCRRYDNHILYGVGIEKLSTRKIFELSQNMIVHKKGFYSGAYDFSYTDVFDFCSEKKSLKMWEIELQKEYEHKISYAKRRLSNGAIMSEVANELSISEELLKGWLDGSIDGTIHHKELGLSWNEPIPEELWDKVAEYCENDVVATEAVFDARRADFTARQILADVAVRTVNTPTNTLSAAIIFHGNKNPQSQFNYRNLAGDDPIPLAEDNKFTVFDEQGRPIFPGYKFEKGKSFYRGEEVGEGGYVYAEPGIYTNVALLDIASMHPSSIIAENLFGNLYTQRFKEIKDARVAIKHGDWNKAETLLDGKLAPSIQKIKRGELDAKDLAYALKIVINSVYGLTAAKFDNQFRDPRNKDNIVAKRGALFMVNLKHEVQERGFTVAHIKTDSIKIPNATPDIIQFVMDYGKKYGYTFEHEATYDRMCLVNDAVYIAKYKGGDHDGEWTPTGTQFQVPYVFKTLFSKEPIEFSDMCETKQVSTALYLDMNEGLPEGEHNYIFVGKVGRFCPMKKGTGGGLLMRQKEDKYTGEKSYGFAGGAKGYRWMESEMVKTLHKENDIDRSYYEKLVNAAVDEISKYGDFEWFVSDDKREPVPPWDEPDDPWNESTDFDKR